jgi:S-(hydroxymethyl)glutathione dehydrogenase/alcohol dehydrogenase
MSRNLRAAVLRHTGKALSVEEIKSYPLTYGQVLVRVIYSGICRSQLMEQLGKRGKDEWLPHLLGHEGYGVVDEIGPGVTKCKPGDRVVMSWIAASGINADNPKYLDSCGSNVNSGKITTFSNFSVISENRLFLAPSGFREEFLPLFGCAVLTGGGMAIKYGESLSTKAICIIGFGGIGSAAALVLKGMGKPLVVIVEKSFEKRRIAEILGFEKIYSDLSEVIEKFDLVIEASGDSDAIEEGFSSLSNSGTIVFASHPNVGSKISLDPYELIKGKRIFGTWGGDINPDEDTKSIADFLLKSDANLDLLIGDLFTIDEVNEGLAYLDSGKPGRPILKLNEV